MVADFQKHIHLVEPAYRDGQELHFCREVITPTASQIAELLKKEPAVIEPGLIALDSDLFIPSVGEIDVVGLSKGRLVLISTFGELNADLLGKAAGIQHWAHDNSSILEHVYKGNGLKENSAPRILFLCSKIDQSAKLLIPLLTDLPLEVYRYRCLESAKSKLLVVERATEEENVRLPIQTKKVPPKKAVPDLQVKPSSILTEEEIHEFFKSDSPAPTEEDLGLDGPYFK